MMDVFFTVFDIKACIFNSDVNLGSSVGVGGWRQMDQVTKHLHYADSLKKRIGANDSGQRLNRLAGFVLICCYLERCQSQGLKS